jgi:hypothetical protein
LLMPPLADFSSALLILQSFSDSTIFAEGCLDRFQVRNYVIDSVIDCQ